MERHGRAAKGKGQELQSQEVVKDYYSNNGFYWTDDVGDEGRVSKNHGGCDFYDEKGGHGDGSNAGNSGGNKVSFYVKISQVLWRCFVFVNSLKFVACFRMCMLHITGMHEYSFWVCTVCECE